jgi:hypothetical protein
VESVDNRLWSGDVGVPDIQEIDLDASSDGFIGIRLEFPDGRSLDGAAAFGNMHE